MVRVLLLLSLFVGLSATARDCPGAGCLLGDFGCLEAQKRCAVEVPDGTRAQVDTARAPASFKSKCEMLYNSCLASCPGCDHDCAKSREKCEME